MHSLGDGTQAVFGGHGASKQAFRFGFPTPPGVLAAGSSILKQIKRQAHRHRGKETDILQMIVTGWRNYGRKLVKREFTKTSSCPGENLNWPRTIDGIVAIGEEIFRVYSFVK